MTATTTTATAATRGHLLQPFNQDKAALGKRCRQHHGGINDDRPHINGLVVPWANVSTDPLVHWAIAYHVDGSIHREGRLSCDPSVALPCGAAEQLNRSAARGARAFDLVSPITTSSG